MQKKLFFLAVILVIITVLFFIWQFSVKQDAIKRANIFLKEYKTAKALEVLNQARGMKSGKDSKLDFLYFYALVKSNRFDEAKKVLNDAKPFPREFKDEISELIKLISIKGQTELLIKTISKSQNINLNQNTLIEISKERNSIDEEMKFLEVSHEILRKRYKNKSSHLRKIEEYLLTRYIDGSRTMIGNQNFNGALEYLRKAQRLSLLDDSTYKDDYHLNLGLAYRGMGENSKAFDNFQLSADSGNSMAKDILNQMSDKYVPQSDLRKKHNDENDDSIKEIDYHESETEEVKEKAEN